MLYCLCVFYFNGNEFNAKKRAERMSGEKKKADCTAKRTMIAGLGNREKSEEKVCTQVAGARVRVLQVQNEMVNNSDRVQLFHTWVNAIVCIVFVTRNRCMCMDFRAIFG